MLKEHEAAKQSQLNKIGQLFDQYNQLKKAVKDIRKEITPLVQSEDERNKTLIKKLEDELKDFFAQIKKRDFYKYQGVAVANEALEKIQVEI